MYNVTQKFPSFASFRFSAPTQSLNRIALKTKHTMFQPQQQYQQGPAVPPGHQLMSVQCPQGVYAGQAVSFFSYFSSHT